MIILYFLSNAVIYFLLNRPFLKLKCHHDAGWHSYWAAFRAKGAGLSDQLNILLGCARLGSIYYFDLLFKFFGLCDPEAISRRVFLLLNYAAHIILFFALSMLFPDHKIISFIVPLIYLIYSSNPFFGIHYESSERMSAIINIILFWFLAHGLVHSTDRFFIIAVLIMSLTTLFFKITYLLEYSAIFLFLLLYAKNKLAFLGWSGLMMLLALSAFAAVLAKLKILKKESFTRIVGYLSKGAGRETFIASGEDVLAKLMSEYGDIVKPIIKYAFPILGSSKFIVASALAGFMLKPHFDLEALLLMWLCGVSLSIIIQRKYILLHFIPFILPISIASGIGAYKIYLRAANPVILGTIILFSSIVLFSDFKRWLSIMTDSKGQPLEYNLWPRYDRYMIDENLSVYEIKDYIKSNASEDDYIFVWGTVPQTYVLCQRRSPIGWLSTIERHIKPILPDWKELTIRAIYESPPRYVIDFLGTFRLDTVLKATGLRYEFDRKFFGDKFTIYKLAGETNKKLYLDKELINAF